MKFLYRRRSSQEDGRSRGVEYDVGMASGLGTKQSRQQLVSYLQRGLLMRLIKRIPLSTSASTSTSTSQISRRQRASPKLTHRTFQTKPNLNMPLVVPGITSTSGDNKTEEWMNKLVGKKIGENSDATVSCFET